MLALGDLAWVPFTCVVNVANADAVVVVDDDDDVVGVVVVFVCRL
jgi:hypothetical protein